MKMTKKSNDFIEVNKDVLNGIPVFKGTRVPVSLILEYLASGWSINDLKDSYPTVKSEYISMLLKNWSQEFQKCYGQIA